MASALSTELAAAASEAQAALAQMQGMNESATGNFTYAGAPYFGVFGDMYVVEIPQPGGGYRKREQMTLTVTKDQTAFNPESKKQIIRLLPNVLYVIDSVKAHDPFHWVLTLVRTGT